MVDIELVIRLSYFLIFLATLGVTEGQEHHTPLTQQVKIFQSLFQQKRAEHKAAVETVLNFKDYIKQQKMVNIIAEKAFEVLEQNQVVLREAGYIPGMDFPEEEKVRDAFSQTLENTAFMGEVLLHLPDITHDLLRDHKPWQLLFTWGVFFATQSKFLDKNTASFIYLVSQELGIAEKDPHYTNPYSKQTRHKVRRNAAAASSASTKEKKKKSFKKGPQLSRHFGDL